MKRGLRYASDGATSGTGGALAARFKGFSPIVNAQAMMDKLVQPTSSLSIASFLVSDTSLPSGAPREVLSAFRQLAELNLARLQISNLLSLSQRYDLEFQLGPLTASAINRELEHLGLGRSAVENLLRTLAISISSSGFEPPVIEAFRLLRVYVILDLVRKTEPELGALPPYGLELTKSALSEVGLSLGMIVPVPIVTKLQILLPPRPNQ